jgi:hypothetical protein
MRPRFQNLLLIILGASLFGATAETARAALLGLSNIIPTPQPYVTAEEISGGYHWTAAHGKTPGSGLLTLSGDGTSGGSITWTEAGITHIFPGYGRWSLSLTVNDAGTVFSGTLTVRGNRQGGAALDSGDGKTDEILFQSSLMKRFGYSVEPASPGSTWSDLFEFVFTQQATGSLAYGPVGGSIGVIVPLGQTGFTGTGTTPFNISDFSVAHVRPTAFYPEPSALVLSGFGTAAMLLRRRRAGKRMTSRARGHNRARSTQ